jgi:hypothetical protein
MRPIRIMPSHSPGPAVYQMSSRSITGNSSISWSYRASHLCYCSLGVFTAHLPCEGLVSSLIDVVSPYSPSLRCQYSNCFVVNYLPSLSFVIGTNQSLKPTIQLRFLISIKQNQAGDRKLTISVQFHPKGCCVASARWGDVAFPDVTRLEIGKGSGDQIEQHT